MSADRPDVDGEDDNPYASVDLLPDRARASNPWAQLIRDLTAPAPMSHWAAEVTSTRIKKYDQIRAFVTRGLLLVALAILLSVAPGTWWLTWVLLIPAAIQVVFEIYLDFEMNDSDPTDVPGLKTLVEIAETAHNTTLVNVTGVVGFVAVPCNIVAVSYFTGPDEPSWVKVLALGVAAAYGVSAIMSFLTDATHYSAHQSQSTPYRIFAAVRPYVWLIIAVAMTAIIAGSIVRDRWAPDMAPLAWALCTAPVLIGQKQRDYERFLRASSERLAQVQQGAKKVLTKDYHNTHTSIRVFNRDLAEDDSVPAGIRVKAAALAPLISLMPEAIDHDEWVMQRERPSLAGIVAKGGSDASLELSIDIRLDDLSPHNYELARALFTALLVNVGQAVNRLTREAKERGDEPIDKRVFVTGEVRDGQVHIAVRDALPPIEDWALEGSTTRWLHQDLKAHGSRHGLKQHLVDEKNSKAGKEIRASWPVKKPPLGLRDVKR